MNKPAPVVAIFNTSPDTVELLRIALESEGFITLAAYTFDLRDGKVDLEALVRQHRIDAVVYDVAPPYDKNWRLFEHLKATPALEAIPFVVTTTNAQRVREVAGGDSRNAIEIVGKPYDLQLIIDAVNLAIGRDR